MPFVKLCALEPASTSIGVLPIQLNNVHLKWLLMQGGEQWPKTEMHCFRGPVAGWADVHDWQGRILYVTAPPPHPVIFVFWRKDAAPTAGAQRVVSGTETNWWSEVVPLSPSGSWKSFTTFNDIHRTRTLHYKKILQCKVCTQILYEFYIISFESATAEDRMQSSWNLLV